jgi:Ca2+-binding RTX toxin-like protein
MSKIRSLLDLKHLLAKDLGGVAHVGDTFDGWLKFFLNKSAIGIGDVSFRDFATLSDAKSGFWSTEINTALHAAKMAIAGHPTPGILHTNGERFLTEGHDFWVGAAGADKVFAGNGNDVVAAGGGNDTVRGGDGNDLIFGEAGRDSLIGGAGSDTIFGGADDDQLYGWAGNDLLLGGSGRDGLYGNEGNDTLSGGDGDDYLCGGSGTDKLFGGAGADTFAFRGQQPNSVSYIKDFEVLHDRQIIMASVAGGPLTMDMITPYADGLMISFAHGCEIHYENVWDANALFLSMSLFD